MLLTVLMTAPASIVLLVAVLLVTRPKRALLGAMGLRGSRLSHGILSVDLTRSFAENVSGGRLKDLYKSVQRVYVKSGIVARSRRLDWLSMSHVAILWQHERRLHPVFFSALLAVFWRYISFHLCYSGVVDEYRDVNGGLVAFSASVAKGNCIRGMWYYCADSASKSCVFHYTIAVSIWRAHQMRFQFVDLGPSPVAMRSAKEKFGFEFRHDYAPLYEGDIVAVPKLEGPIL